MEGKIGASAGVDKKKSSHSKPPLSSIVGADSWLEGLQLIGVLNSNNVIVVPSTKNFADGVIQFRVAIIDTGCSSCLIRVDSTADFEGILKKYQDKEKYAMYLGSSIGVSGVSETLVVETHGESESFELVLAEDLFGRRAVALKKLRFQLCTDDARFALKYPNIGNLLSTKQLENLANYCSKDIPRIPVSLIGNSVLCKSSYVQHKRVFYCLDAAQCTSISFPKLTKVSQTIMEELDPSVKDMISKIDFDFTTAGDFHFSDTEFDF